MLSTRLLAFTGLLAATGHATALAQSPELDARLAGLGDEPPREHPEERREARFTGRVLGPDGKPFAGAVVLTSAGGEAPTDREGRFELLAQVPLAATEVQVTAVASRGSTLTASRLLDAGGGADVELLLAASSGCNPTWIPSFGGKPGTGGPVRALTVWDDGSGPALYLAGSFSEAGGVVARKVVKWNGNGWIPLGAGVLNFQSVTALAAFEGQGGSALYAAGSFTQAGSTAANNIARWDGNQWMPLSHGTGGWVNALAVFDDGTGPALFAGGLFTHAGGLPASNIAKWDGVAWSVVPGSNSEVHALHVHDGGQGPALFAGGNFTEIGGVYAAGIARYDGTSWRPLGSGVDATVRALTTFNDGNGPALYAGGHFATAGGNPALRVARWNGTSWSALGGGITAPWDAAVRTLATFDDGGGPALIAGGNFTAVDGAPTSNIARWDGSAWSPVGDGAEKSVLALQVADVGAGPLLYVGGGFQKAGGSTAFRIATWDGSAWAPISDSLPYTVFALAVFDPGDGPALHAGGWIPDAGGVQLGHIARWTGSGWAPLGSGMNAEVDGLHVHDDGGGPRLYATGAFTEAGGSPALRVARWDGASWSAVGEGFDATARRMVTHDDGSGRELYVIGSFTASGSTPLNRIARWDGSTWSAVGQGMSSPGSYHLRDLAAFDDGGGERLYVAGTFTLADGSPAGNIARWDGTGWSAVGSGLDEGSFALAVHDDGSGRALYAGGGFTSAGGSPASRVAKWDGTTWTALGSGMNSLVGVLVSSEGSTGPSLFAAGYFTTAGGVAAEHIAEWDGTSWKPLGSLSWPPACAIPFDDGSGPGILVGGYFVQSPAGDSFLVRWGCAPEIGVPYCFGDTGACPCGNSGGPGEGCASSAGAGASISASVSANAAADLLLVHGSGMPPGQSALLFGADNPVNGGLGAPFGDGLRCAGGNVKRLGMRMTDAQGEASWGPGLAGMASYGPGVTARFQIWYRDPVGSPCGNGFNFSHGLEIPFD